MNSFRLDIKGVIGNLMTIIVGSVGGGAAANAAVGRATASEAFVAGAAAGRVGAAANDEMNGKEDNEVTQCGAG